MLEEFLEPPPVGGAVQVLVATYLGRDAWGETYADPVPVWGWVDDSTSVVRTLESEDVTAAAGVFVTPGRAGPLTLGSRVTLPDGRTFRIVTRADRTHGAELGLPVHVEVRLA